MKKIKNIVWVVIALSFVGYLTFKIGQRALKDQLLKKNAQITKAVIIGEKNYYGNERVKPEFSYSYQFEVNGKKYTGNSHNKTVSIGDSIEIEYVKGIPSLNKPLHPNE
jgi:hypothetical protein